MLLYKSMHHLPAAFISREPKQLRTSSWGVTDCGSPGSWVCPQRGPASHTLWASLEAGKESTCSAGDIGSIPVSGRSTGEGIGCPLQYSWASLAAQLVKKSPAVWETWLQSLGWEDPLEKGKATHSSILAWRIPWNVWSMGLQRVRHN